MRSSQTLQLVKIYSPFVIVFLEVEFSSTGTDILNWAMVVSAIFSSPHIIEVRSHVYINVLPLPPGPSRKSTWFFLRHIEQQKLLHRMVPSVVHAITTSFIHFFSFLLGIIESCSSNAKIAQRNE